MTVVYTADVFCDADECSQWISGVSSPTPPLRKDARAEHASREGWTHKAGRDLCPHHSKPAPTGEKD